MPGTPGKECTFQLATTGKCFVGWRWRFPVYKCKYFGKPVINSAKKSTEYAQTFSSWGSSVSKPAVIRTLRRLQSPPWGMVRTNKHTAAANATFRRWRNAWDFTARNSCWLPRVALVLASPRLPSTTLSWSPCHRWRTKINTDHFWKYFGVLFNSPFCYFIVLLIYFQLKMNCKLNSFYWVSRNNCGFCDFPPARPVLACDRHPGSLDPPPTHPTTPPLPSGGGFPS